jgi:PAN domain
MTSPTDGVVYVVDTSSKWIAKETLTQCTVQCGFSTSLNNGGTCRCFNYNSTSMNCSLFNYEPTETESDQTNKTGAFQVTLQYSNMLQHQLNLVSFPILQLVGPN